MLHSQPFATTFPLLVFLFLFFCLFFYLLSFLVVWVMLMLPTKIAIFVLQFFFSRCQIS